MKRPLLPVDVLSGVSGGALIGAYYCAAGTTGCDDAISQGWQFQAALPSFALWSQTLEWLIDFNLGRRSIATLATRFVPVAVCLMRGEPPETRIMLDKTIGEAVRASGSLPVVFGPSTLDGEYYADGAFGSIIPAQAVTLYGADMVVAVNCIAGPSFGSAFDHSDAFQFFRRLLPIGRFVDLWISIAYLQQEASRLVARSESAPFLIEPAKSEAPFLEMAAFINAKGIAAKASDDKSFMQGVEHAINKWKMFADLRANAKHRRNGGRPAETRSATPRGADDATS
jgi:predicted acylesterase/phospholipase RssA